MAWGVDEVQHILLSIGRLVIHAGSLELDCDPAFPLQLHIVQELLLHVPIRNRAGVLQQTISQCRLAMVDMGNDAKISDPGDGSVCHAVGVFPARADLVIDPILGSDHLQQCPNHEPFWGLRKSQSRSSRPQLITQETLALRRHRTRAMCRCQCNALTGCGKCCCSVYTWTCYSQ